MERSAATATRCSPGGTTRRSTPSRGVRGRCAKQDRRVVPLYETRAARESHRSEETRDDLAQASRRWGSAFERVMLLRRGRAIESGHELNVVLAEIDWQATGRIEGTLEEVAGAAPGGVPRHQRLPRGRRGDLGIRAASPARSIRSAICWSARPRARLPKD